MANINLPTYEQVSNVATQATTHKNVTDNIMASLGSAGVGANNNVAASTNAKINWMLPIVGNTNWLVNMKRSMLYYQNADVNLFSMSLAFANGSLTINKRRLYWGRAYYVEGSGKIVAFQGIGNRFQILVDNEIFIRPNMSQSAGYVEISFRTSFEVLYDTAYALDAFGILYELVI